VDHQNVKFFVWLGIAVLALLWANTQIWQARRVLSRAGQDRADQPARTIPSTVAEPAGAVIAQ